jgi:hypothetical protein
MGLEQIQNQVLQLLFHRASPLMVFCATRTYYAQGRLGNWSPRLRRAVGGRASR